MTVGFWICFTFLVPVKTFLFYF